LSTVYPYNFKFLEITLISNHVEAEAPLSKMVIKVEAKIIVSYILLLLPITKFSSII